MLRLLLSLMMTWVMFSTSLPAQRVVASLDASSLGAELKFDTNSIPLRNFLTPSTDLNFSPNVVFSSDSSKAFVSIPASNKVAVIDTRSGQFFPAQPLLEVGKNPVLITPTPDGRKLAVVCISIQDNLPSLADDFQGKRVGTISIIDTETLEVRNLDLTGVLFSFTSNVVFSADGSRGFVPSPGTDEILRFNLETLEAPPDRLKLPDGTRPSSLTMAPDFSFLAAVLVGSTGLPQVEVPDSIQVIDPESLTVIRSIVPEVEDPILPPHNLFAVNTLAISPDSRFGLIGDREIGALGGSLGLDDHALLLDLETGETVKVLEVGQAPSGSFSVPGGNRFVTVSRREWALIDPEEDEASRIVPLFSGFHETSRPAFSIDGKTMWIASSVRDFLMEFDLEGDVITDTVDLGPNLIVEDPSGPITVPAGPLDLAWSPDRSVLTSVKFNANRIVLLQETERVFFPRLLSDGEFFTGISLTNYSSATSTVSFTPLTPLGSPFVDSLDTPELDFQAPQDRQIQPGTQISLTARELMQAIPEASIDGWLEVETLSAQLAPLLLMGDVNARRLDTIAPQFRTLTEMVLPEVRVAEGFRTELNIANPNGDSARVTLRLVRSDGEIIEENSFSIGARNLTTGFLRQGDNPLFSSSSFTNFPGGYITVSSQEGVVAFERYFDEERLATVNAIPVTTEAATSYLPHVSAFGDSSTELNLIHAGQTGGRVTLRLKGDQGENLGDPVSVDMNPGQQLKIDLVELFDLPPQASVLTGWLTIQSEVPGITAAAELTTFGGRAITIVAAERSPSLSLLFPYLSLKSGLSTGLVFLNPGSESAQVEIQVISQAGTTLGSETLTLAPSGRLVGLLEDLFPSLGPLSGGYVRSSADHGIIGSELFFADSLEFLVSVPAQTIGP